MELGHKPATKPDNENSRLKDLKDLKIIEENIEKSKRFSSFPRLAAMLTECDKAAINIVDDTSQHCKVNFGMDAIENMMVREIPRELSVCAHVLNNASERSCRHLQSAEKMWHFRASCTPILLFLNKR